MERTEGGHCLWCGAVRCWPESVKACRTDTHARVCSRVCRALRRHMGERTLAKRQNNKYFPNKLFNLVSGINKKVFFTTVRVRSLASLVFSHKTHRIICCDLCAAVFGGGGG